MKKLIAILFVAFSGCDNKLEYTYFQNGKIRSKAEILNKKNHGLSWEYYASGELMSKRSWKDGLLDGPFEVYYENGKISKRGVSTRDKFVELITYFPSGVVEKIYTFDSLGQVLEVSAFMKNGELESEAYPYISTIPPGDTLKRGMPATIRARIVNVADSIYESGQLIITSALDTLSSQGKMEITDTVQVIYPTDKRTFLYKFTPKDIGNCFLSGQFVFTKEMGDEVTIKTQVFSFKYYVTE